MFKEPAKSASEAVSTHGADTHRAQESQPASDALNGNGKVSRVLVVDDFEPFRRYACSALEGRPALQVVGEAADGLEAVQKAMQLQPDLILMDIGMPHLNGLEAADRIRELAPDSKILFLTQESSTEIVREALDRGAIGYLVKASAGSELLPAADAVLQGRTFISSEVRA
jgi:DNA-binding NarL/FixJ family response regulator